jgi:hypothetical protein
VAAKAESGPAKARLPGGNVEIGRLLGGGGAPLAGDVRDDLESAFGGADFASVRVHPRERAANRALGAEAFTTGSDIFLSGQVDAGSGDGRELLGHELAHVVQQRSGAASGVSAPGDPAEVQARQVGRAVRARMPEAVVEALGAQAGNAAVARQVSRLAVQRSPADDLIDDKTSWGNLDEEALGFHLLYRALSGQHAFVQEVFDDLGTMNRDDVALELTSAATVQQLATLAGSETGRRLLDRLYDELTGGHLAGDEKEQAERILAVKGQAIDPAQAEKQMLTGKVFPFRQGGITVWDDAPIMAERRDKGRIWVKQPTRVLHTDMFKDEIRTLPHDVFIGGFELPENEVIGVKLYDLGGPTVYRPALFLIEIANQNETATLTKIAEIAGIGLTLGTGALAGLGVEAGMMARVLLWADRAAFVLGTVAMVINEHRGEIIERYGDAGLEFLHYVDLVQSATAIYGFARLALAMGQILNGFRAKYANWRATVRQVQADLDEQERLLAKQLAAQTDEVLENADNIKKSQTAAERDWDKAEAQVRDQEAAAEKDFFGPKKPTPGKPGPEEVPTGRPGPRPEAGPGQREFEPPLRMHQGKAEGELPQTDSERTAAINSWTDQEMRDAAGILERSIPARQAEQAQMGETSVGPEGQQKGYQHRLRIEAERRLLRALRKKLGGS